LIVSVCQKKSSIPWWLKSEHKCAGRDGQPNAPEHASKLSVQNRLLMLLQWLVHYPTYEELAIQFGIAASTVGKELYHSMSVTINALAGEIQWPSPAERSQLALLWPHTSGAFAAIDTNVPSSL